jgi:tetratricopeptide (TPR) repeat protein
MKNNLCLLALVFLLIACNSGTDPATVNDDAVTKKISAIRDSIKKYPGDTLLKYGLVAMLQENKRYREAIAVLDSINIVKDSAHLKTYISYLYKRAQLLQFAGDTIEAIKTLEMYVIPGELTESGMRLAYLFAETKNRKAILYGDAMIKNDISGMDPNPDYIKGVYYANTGQTDSAILHFDACIQKDYTFLDAHMEKGRILYNTKKYPDAIQVYDLAIKVSSTFADAFYWKAKCQEAIGQKTEAKENYLKAYSLDNTMTEAKEAADRFIN